MKLASILDQYHDAFQAKYGSRLLPSQLLAIDAISQCRTPQAGQLLAQCIECGHEIWQPRSCGHRNCPQCQNHETSLWLDRQQAKLLPVEYFMAIFTLPYELRSLAWHNQTLVYNLLFACASSTLKDFGLNPKNLYRGVIAENNIVSNQNGNITFKYIKSRTGDTRLRSLKGEDFLWLVLQHVLPKSFRRVRCLF
jgi:hypothetical protein